jgi:hypothetical protein
MMTSSLARRAGGCGALLTFSPVGGEVRRIDVIISPAPGHVNCAPEMES